MRCISNNVALKALLLQTLKCNTVFNTKAVILIFLKASLRLVISLRSEPQRLYIVKKYKKQKKLSASGSCTRVAVA